jgi:hypothetical protein
MGVALPPVVVPRKDRNNNYDDTSLVTLGLACLFRLGTFACFHFRLGGRPMLRPRFRNFENELLEPMPSIGDEFNI